MSTYYPGMERDALNYLGIQDKQRKLLEEAKRENPSLLSRMMKAGMLAVLGAMGASLLDQDPLKGAVAGAAAGIILPLRRQAPNV